jgi:hypothetical protein
MAGREPPQLCIDSPSGTPVPINLRNFLLKFFAAAKENNPRGHPARSSCLLIVPVLYDLNYSENCHRVLYGVVTAAVMLQGLPTRRR